MKRVIVGCISVVVIMITVFFAAFTYKTKYCKTEVLQSVSPDERYTLKIYMIGEPDWPFGPTHCRYDFCEGNRILEKYSDTVFNDGKNAVPEDFEIYWKEDSVNLIVHGEEQEDKGITFFFDGRKTKVTNDHYEIQKLTDDMKNTCEFDDEKKIIEVYQLYADVHSVSKTEKHDEIIRELVMLYGSNHFPSIDSNNKVDMVSGEYLTEFCKNVSNKEDGKCTLIAVDSPTRIIRFGLESHSGLVTVYKTCYEFTGENVEIVENIAFEADEWKADEDYLMFSGSFYSGVMYALAMNDGLEYGAIRIASIDAECRELAEIDALKIGYEANNVFLVDWNETDYSMLDTDDIIGYLSGKNIINLAKCACEEDEAGNRIYYIPEKEYEEGVDYELINDSKVRLIVNAVYPQMLTHNVLTSEVVIRKNKNGAYRICSNKVISKDETKLNWHVDRLTTRTAFVSDGD